MNINDVAVEYNSGFLQDVYTLRDPSMEMTEVVPNLLVKYSVGEGSVVPTKAKRGDAGYDIVANTDPIIVGLSTVSSAYTDIYYIEYGTGIHLEIPEGVYFEVFPRSSISNTNLVLANSVGVIDNGYRGEIKLRFRYLPRRSDYIGSSQIQFAPDPKKIYQKGDRIGQLIPKILAPTICWSKVDKVSEDTVRGFGGFGHTGA